MIEKDRIVFQVRCVDVNGNVRIVHAYETQQQAIDAIRLMDRKQPGRRYITVPVPNQPDQYWGINFPPKA